MEGEFVLYKREIPNIEEEIKKIVELADVGRGWNHVSTADNVNCYCQKSDRSSFDYILGEGIIHTTPEVLLQFLQDPHTTTEIDPAITDREEIVRLSDTSRVMRLRYKFPAPLTDREFNIYDGVISDNPKTVVCASISIEHEKCPEDSQYVRGIILTSGYITQVPARTHVSYVIQLDPKGWIPSVVANIICTEQARNVLRLKKYFERDTEQTFKFPPQFQRSLDTAHTSDGGEANGSDSTPNHEDWHQSDSNKTEWNTADAGQVVWRRADGADRGTGEKILGLIDNALDTEQDKESKETLLDASTAPMTASRLLQNLLSLH